MTREQVKTMVTEMGVVFDHDHPDHINRNKLQTLAPPFVEYFLEDHVIWADGRRYISFYDMTLRIYSEAETSMVETDVQSVLESYDIRWKREVQYIQEMYLFAIIYTMEV